MFAICHGRCALLTIGAAALVALSAASGCNRTHYRQQADQEAVQMVVEKSYDPRWGMPGFTIEMDPRSRFHTPYDPDFPPMPPDDPDAHQYMHCIDGMKGYKRWHANGYIHDLENPFWRENLAHYTQQTEDGNIMLSLEDAVQLSLIHNPAYQQQLETVYLSALDVSTERFRFEVQFFGGNRTTFEHQGALRGPLGETNTLTTVTDFEMRKRFATAGELLVGFANTFVWQFAGPDTNFTTSLLNFSLVQPLLRGGGRVIALEQLTIAERGLLANLRAFQRYQQGFYTNVAIGELGVAGPQRRGGFFGGTGLTGFTGQGTGGFGGVGEATGFGRGGFAGPAAAGVGVAAGFVGGGAGLVGGYIGLLQQLQQIRNTEASLDAQLRTLALLEANLEAGLIDLAQVDQFRQSIESERANLLQARNGLENALENFITFSLGLPPDLPIELDDTMIRPFQLISTRLTGIQTDIADFMQSFGELPREPEIAAIEIAFDQIARIGRQTAGEFASVRGDLELLQEQIDRRTVGMTPIELRTFLAEVRRLPDNVDTLERRLERAATELETLREGLQDDNRAEIADRLVALSVEISNILGELSLVQGRSRLEQVSVEPANVTPEEAFEIARIHRLDWMNNRAALVDTWRLIEFNANALESNLTIFFDGDMGTVGSNPLDFRGPTGRLRAGVQFDAPITRIIERNNFRQQLINYQQAHRQLIQFEDGVNRSLRQILREMEQLEVNLEIQRRAVAIAIRRVDQTREALSRPIAPAAPGAPPAQFGPTAALNLLTAFSDLRSSQNNFMSVWLNYHAARMRLLRELGVMRIDERGLWVDEPLIPALLLPLDGHDHELLPPPVPTEWLQPGGIAGPELLDESALPPAPEPQN
jgi:hypothetical protein